MHASMGARGASAATAGSPIRSVAGAVAPASENRLATLWSKALGSTWVRPAAKLVLVMTLVAGLSWIGSRANALGVRIPALAAPSGSLSLASLAPSPASARPTEAADAGAVGPEAATPSGPGVLPDGRVVLNLASEDELRKLPKVGPKRASQIVALRQRMGKFRSTRDLLRVKGLGLRTLQKMQPMMVLDPPVEGADGGR
ncbi:MAG: helix-hairpin-helix domain-containing protein [Deltaproteobacteria bacterium]|nr:helix-hairpin-helix domain-containing protein [Deltaproteobacteria bacterium]